MDGARWPIHLALDLLQARIYGPAHSTWETHIPVLIPMLSGWGEVLVSQRLNRKEKDYGGTCRHHARIA
jgi:hypothetical protein